MGDRRTFFAALPGMLSGSGWFVAGRVLIGCFFSCEAIEDKRGELKVKEKAAIPAALFR